LLAGTGGYWEIITHMRLFINAIDYTKTQFPDGGLWDRSQLPESPEAGFENASISVAPPGKHDLNECPKFERLWRAVFPDIVKSLKGETRVCLAWATGPLLSDMLVPFLQYVDLWNDAGSRYHVASVTSPGGKGYHTSWIAFECEREALTEMMKNKELELEWVRLSMLFVQDDLVASVLSRPFWEVGLTWAIAHRALALTTSPHFEGCYIVGPRAEMDDAMARVRQLRGDK